jgi:hypothetical protein
MKKKSTIMAFLLLLALAALVIVECEAYTLSGTYTLNSGTATETNQTYTSNTEDTSAIYVTNGANLILTNPTITTSGDSSSLDDSSFYGLNAGVLATSGSTITISGGAVITTGSGANGVFSTGSGTSITLSNVSISAIGQGGHGVDATLGGTLTLTDVDITTAGANGAAVATDRGGGTITVTGGTIVTSGADSPGIYSTGTITVAGATITATGAEAAVIEGLNSITLTDTIMSGAEKRGAMIYQSMSGDASVGTGTFTMTGGSLTATVGPAFYVTNTRAVITLNGDAQISANSGILLSASADNWGTSGSNGGTVTFTANSETLAGNIISDSISSISVTLENGTSLTGSINSAALSLDSTSTWNVTADSILTSLTDASGVSGTTIANIYGNGYTVYYDASLSANSALGGLTYSLADGGVLTPMGAVPEFSTLGSIAMLITVSTIALLVSLKKARAPLKF